MSAIDSSKRQDFDADVRAIQQINFTTNLDKARNKTMSLIIEEAKETQTFHKEIVLRLSSNMVCNSNDESNFPHELLLTNKQVANLRNVFTNNLSTDVKLSKT